MENLPDDDFDRAVDITQMEFDRQHHADVSYGLTSPISWLPSPISRHCS